MIRALRLIEQLTTVRRAWTLQLLAAHLGVSERTIRRDLILLEASGLHIEWQRQTTVTSMHGRSLIRFLGWPGVGIGPKPRYTVEDERRAS